MINLSLSTPGELLIKCINCLNSSRNASILVIAAVLVGCTPKVEVATSDPITINLNVKIEHEIRVKVEKELEDVFSEDSGLF